MSKIKEWIGYDYKPMEDAVPYMIQELVDHETVSYTHLTLPTKRIV